MMLPMTWCGSATRRMEEPPNPRMDLPERLAACGVLRPPHLRRPSAAHAPVGRVRAEFPETAEMHPMVRAPINPLTFYTARSAPRSSASKPGLSIDLAQQPSFDAIGGLQAPFLEVMRG
jgi:hypothetical protein